MVAARKVTRRKKQNRRSPKKMMALRRKFVEQCKKYIGTPYKRKYHEPGTPGYNSSLFLDCCGLVRRAIQDLKADFGFDIGPWNQAYMYDTLPTTVLKEANMKPGDLVFISGTYFNKKMKPQVHGIVHVEVWLGDGRKTIGARWHKGLVQVFDSYRFKSTSYHSMRYHFKSINPWLMEVCKSHCPMHAWRRPTDFRPSKRSVLHIKGQQQQQQQNSSDVDQLQNLATGQRSELTENDTGEILEFVTEGNFVEERIKETEFDGQRAISASTSSEDGSQEMLMADVMLSGSDVDVLSERLRILPVKDVSGPKVFEKSVTYVQVSKSMGEVSAIDESSPSASSHDSIRALSHLA